MSNNHYGKTDEGSFVPIILQPTMTRVVFLSDDGHSRAALSSNYYGVDASLACH